MCGLTKDFFIVNAKSQSIGEDADFCPIISTHTLDFNQVYRLLFIGTYTYKPYVISFQVLSRRLRILSFRSQFNAQNYKVEYKGTGILQGAMS